MSWSWAKHVHECRNWTSGEVGRMAWTWIYVDETVLNLVTLFRIQKQEQDCIQQYRYASWKWIDSRLIDYINNPDNIYSLSCYVKPICFLLWKTKGVQTSCAKIFRFYSTYWSVHHIELQYNFRCRRIYSSALVIRSVFLTLACLFGPFNAPFGAWPGHWLLSVYRKENHEQ